MNHGVVRNLGFVLLFLYLLVLLKLIVFKGKAFYKAVPTSARYIRESQTGNLRDYNLIPFRNITRYITADIPLLEKLFNVLGNVILFIPLGFLLSVVLPSARFRNVFLFSCLLSIAFELTQLFAHRGTCDIDDVILNTLGGMTGYFLLVRLKKLRIWPQSCEGRT